VAAVARWSALNERHRGAGWPDRNAEYLLYQTLVGAHPLPLDRALQYMEKASREAKQHTSWVDPDPAYDEVLADFVRRVLADPRFVDDLDRFVAPLVEPGRVNGLAQTLLKLTSPGVPDLYQGAELWTDGLVDPDNRRPVDFPLRCRLLDEVAALGPEQWLKRADEGLPKLALVARTLDVRRRRPELFLAGPFSAYRPLVATGRAADHVVAFARGDGLCVVVPRLPVRLERAGGWGDTAVELPAGRWRSELGGGEEVEGGNRWVAELLGRFPVAVLIASAEEA
jgi:(1->4)-alpha-D-glucan 1-alpha-D-glucosylmutase